MIHPKLALLLALSVSLPASANDAASTLASCTAILPPGEVLEFKIQGTINTSLPESITNSTISLSNGDGEENPPPWRDELELFLACVEPLVVGADGQN